MTPSAVRDSASGDAVTLDVAGQVAVITLNRPDKLNVFPGAMGRAQAGDRRRQRPPPPTRRGTTRS